MTIRTAILEARFLLGDEDAVRRAAYALRQRSGAATPAPNSSPPSSPNATSATARRRVAAIWSSRTSRTAKAACATCRRCSGSPNISTACASRRSWSSSGVFDTRGIPAVPQREDFLWAVRCHMHFLTGTRRGAPVLRHPARDRRAPRLHRASRPAGCRALHEALLPGRQGCRRPDRASSAPRSKTRRPRACRCSTA